MKKTIFGLGIIAIISLAAIQCKRDAIKAEHICWSCELTNKTTGEKSHKDTCTEDGYPPIEFKDSDGNFLSSACSKP